MLPMTRVDDEAVRATAIEKDLRIQLLGSPEIAWHGQPVAITRRQARALLYRLAASPHPTPRDELCFLFWPDIGETAARRQLTVLLNHLRRELPSPDLVQTVNDAIDLDRSRLWTDVNDFEHGLTQASSNHGLASAQAALALYPGPFLHGFSLPTAAEFEAWLTQQRAAFEQQWLDLLTTSVEGFIAAGDYPAAIQHAQRHLAVDEKDEHMHRRLMWLYATTHDPIAALRQFDVCADLLERDLNLSPSPQTWALFDAIRNGTFHDESDSNPSDLTPSSRPSQLAPPLVPPLARLPTPPNPLLGRATELAAASALLRGQHARLLTLTGPGGSGKTRLALEVAAGLRDAFPDGMAFVSLAALRDPALLCDAIARACGLNETREKALREDLQNYLGDKHLLLVLDNLEHLLPAAPVIAELLASAPNLRIVATSRAALRLSGESVLPVPPLPLPDLTGLLDVAALAKQPAVALLLARARAHNAAFQPTADNAADLAAICVRLDGLPLAIELAAARLKVLAPSALLRRLDDRLALLTDGPRDLPIRQQMLCATIDWSYQLLNPTEQALLDRLAVFAGGWTMEAAEAIGMADVNTLTSLVDNSLIYGASTANGEMRFAMLETIREFALERLRLRDDAEDIRQRHATHFLALAERADLSQLRSERQAWLDQLEREHDNLRAALAWSSEAAPELAVRLASNIWWLWHARGHLSEGRAWMTRILELCDDLNHADIQPNHPNIPAPLRASVLYGAAGLAWDQSDFATARVHAEAALAIHVATGDDAGRAELLCILGDIASAEGGYGEANRLLTECLVIGRALDDARIVALALGNLGSVAVSQGRYDQATDLFEESLALFRTLGYTGGIAQIMYELGNIDHFRGDYARAAQRFQESLLLFQKMGSRRSTAWVMNKLGEVAQFQNEAARAIQFYEDSLVLFRELGNREGIALVLHNLGYEALQQGNSKRARELHQESLKLFRQAGIKWGEGVALGLLGLVANAESNYPLAIETLEHSRTIWQQLDNPRFIATTLNRLGEVALNQREPDQAGALYQDALQLAQAVNDRGSIAASLEGIAAVLTHQLDMAPSALVRQVAYLLGAAEALRAATGAALRPVERTNADRALAAIRTCPDDAAFLAARAEGRAAPTTQAVAQALELASVRALDGCIF